MKNPDTVSLRSLFSTSGLYYFFGKIHKEQDKLVLAGKYALTPLIKLVALCFVLLSAVSVCGSVAGVAYAFFLLLDTEVDLMRWFTVLLVAVATCLASALFCVLIYFLSRINNNVIRPYRTEMRQFLIGLASTSENGA